MVRRAPKVSQTVNIEFPILVYYDRKDRAWVAQSLMTCTTSVSDTVQKALDELCGLLQCEVEEAFASSKGDVGKALAAITFPAPQDLFTAFHMRARVLECQSPKARSQPKGRGTAIPPVTFAPRQAVAYA